MLKKDTIRIIFWDGDKGSLWKVELMTLCYRKTMCPGFLHSGTCPRSRVCYYAVEVPSKKDHIEKKKPAMRGKVETVTTNGLWLTESELRKLEISIGSLDSDLRRWQKVCQIMTAFNRGRY